MVVARVNAVWLRPLAVSAVRHNELLCKRAVASIYIAQSLTSRADSAKVAMTVDAHQSPNRENTSAREISSIGIGNIIVTHASRTPRLG